MVEMLLALKFFTGCWTLEIRGQQVDEAWSRPHGGTMLGYSRTVRGGKTVEYEYIRIEVRENGLALIPTIKGKETVFKSAKLSAEEAVFENPEHDFPQRIIYRKTPDGLFARVESMDGKKGFDYPYKRGSCTGD